MFFKATNAKRNYTRRKDVERASKLKGVCEVTLGVIPVSLRRFACDVRCRCHSLVWLRRDGDSSFISFPARR